MHKYFCRSCVAVFSKVYKMSYFCFIDAVITDHHHIKRTSIMDVNSAAVPAKHRICAQLIDYKPRTNDPLVFFKVYCPVCNFL